MARPAIKPSFTPDQMQFQLNKSESDFRMQCNLRLAKLEASIQMILQKLEDHGSRQGEFKNTALQEVEKSKDALLHMIAHIQENVRAIGIEARIGSDLTALLKKNMQENYVKLDEFNRAVSDLKGTVSLLTSHVDIECTNSSFKTQHFVGDINHKFEMLRCELMEKPSEAPALRNEFNEKIRILKCDHENHCARATVCEKILHQLGKKLEYVIYKQQQEAK